MVNKHVDKSIISLVNITEKCKLKQKRISTSTLAKIIKSSSKYFEKHVEKWNFHILLVENYLAISYNIKHTFILSSSNSIPWYLPK